MSVALKQVSRKQKLYWTLQLGGWSVYIFINYLSLPLFKTDLPYNGTYFFLSFICGIAVTHAYRYFIRKGKWFDYSIVTLVRNIFIGAAIITSIYFLLLSILDVLLYVGTSGILNSAYPEPVVLGPDYWAFFYLSLLNVYSIFLIWSVLYFVFKYFENYREARYQQLEAQTQLKDAMMLNLRNQLNPHFLFNALNSIRSLTLTDATKARTAITLLSDLLRYTLNSEQKNFVTLNEELDVVKDYLELEKVRFGDRLSFNITAAESTLNAQVPPLAVMTLVENAIKHGIGKLKSGGVVNIDATSINGTVTVEVSNSGTFSPNGNGGIGLANTRQRLHILYNQNATFDIAQQNELVAARIQIPFNA